MSKFVVILFLIQISILAIAKEIPQFKSGDIIFQTSNSNQSYAIMLASKSLYSHVGIIEEDKGEFYVIEAISEVKRTPLKKWINRGRLGLYTVSRIKNLTDSKIKNIVEGAKKYLGRKYDLYFTSNNPEIYCSELVSLAYKEAGIEVGHYQKVSTLDVDNFITRKLFKSRWRKHPLCQEKTTTFDSCWKKVQSDELITPISLYEDKNTEIIFTNYL